MKSVAVVGAGPGGLVAVKTLVHHKDSSFNVTVFEKSSKLGGLWELSRGTSARHGLLSPETPTNLSKFTVGFSDLSWDSVKLEQPASRRHRNHEYSRVPMFPKAWMAKEYLEQYADRYKLRQRIEFGTKVVGAERFTEHGTIKWRLTSQGVTGGAHTTRVFDYLVIATGFFSKPRSLLPSLAPSRQVQSVKVLHSSQYRELDDLLPRDVSFASRNKILVVGGGNSSGEVAGTIAQHISSALHSPTTNRADLAKVEIVHVTPRPLYALPPYVPAPSGASGFVPLDIRLYDFAARPGKIDSYGGKAPEEVVGIVHGAIRSMVGSDQSDLGAPALVSSADGGKITDAAYVALSEGYSEFVRSGLIKPIRGRVISLDVATGDADGSIDARLQDDEGRQQRMAGVAAVIDATGYTPAPALDWLSQEILDTLEYDGEAPRLPLILEVLQTYNSSAPEIGFVGFYEGPYWGVMEMQARLLTELWASASKGTTLNVKQRAFEDKDTLRRLRADMKNKDRLIPQYWFSDYLGYMEEVAVDLGLQRNDHPFENHQGPTSPARYLSSDTSLPEAARIVTDLQRTVLASSKGAFLARATFRALQGKWKLHRKITSASASLPSGTFTGTASLFPRLPTRDGLGTDSEATSDGEYLYAEQGTFNPGAGGSMQASRHYVYRYHEADDALSVWFVKPENPKQVDYLYHDLNFTDIRVVEGEGSRQTATANAEHLCEADLYKTEYEFKFRGIALDTWKCKHTVKGPAKDYVSDAVYKR